MGKIDKSVLLVVSFSIVFLLFLCTGITAVNGAVCTVGPSGYGGSCSTISINKHIDPAGYVYDITTDAKIAGALVWLQKWDGVSTFVNVSNNAGIMDQLNPMITDQYGSFECNATVGLYRIYVQASGYLPNYTANFTLPPEVTNMKIGLTPSDQNSYMINLSTGWNLISLPVDYSIYASSLESNGVTEIVAYNNSLQDFDRGYILGLSPASYDFALMPNAGYWVKCSYSPSFTVTGTALQNRSVPLVAGWNLVGWSTFNTIYASDLEAALPGNQAIYYFDAAKQKFGGYDELYSVTGDFPLKPGSAYFIESDRATTLNFG